MLKSKVLVYTALLVSVVGGLSGCASPAAKDAMIVSDMPEIQKSQKTVAIETQGGSETSSMGSSNISNSDFAKAIEDSIIQNGLFSQVVQRDGADYVLNVSIVNMSKPSFGASFTVDMEAAWSLSDRATGTVVMRESIKSSHTTTMGEAFVGVTRLRLAVEGAARENIRQGLTAISGLQLE